MCFHHDSLFILQRLCKMSSDQIGRQRGVRKALIGAFFWLINFPWGWCRPAAKCMKLLLKESPVSFPLPDFIFQVLTGFFVQWLKIWIRNVNLFHPWKPFTLSHPAIAPSVDLWMTSSPRAVPNTSAATSTSLKLVRKNCSMKSASIRCRNLSRLWRKSTLLSSLTSLRFVDQCNAFRSSQLRQVFFVGVFVR